MNATLVKASLLVMLQITNTKKPFTIADLVTLCVMDVCA
jgi:hypothetical protein